MGGEQQTCSKTLLRKRAQPGNGATRHVGTVWRSGRTATKSTDPTDLHPSRLCGCRTTVVPQPSKLMIGIRFPSPAPCCSDVTEAYRLGKAVVRVRLPRAAPFGLEAFKVKQPALNRQNSERYRAGPPCACDGNWHTCLVESQTFSGSTPLMRTIAPCWNWHTGQF